MQTVIIVAIVAVVVLAIVVLYRGRLTELGIKVGAWSGVLRARPDAGSTQADDPGAVIVEHNKGKRFRLRAPKGSGTRVRRNKLEDTKIEITDVSDQSDS